MADTPEESRALELTGPRDTLPDDPSAAVARPDFPLVRRGYDRDAVDAYVQRVVALVDELEALRSPRTAVRQALERVGAETSGILAQAHATADEVTASARREADELTTSARREAEELSTSSRLAAEELTRSSHRAAEERLARARAEAEEIVRSARERARALDHDADVIWQERLGLLTDVRRIAGDLQRVVDDAEGRFPPETEAATEAATLEDLPTEPEPAPELPPP